MPHHHSRNVFRQTASVLRNGSLIAALLPALLFVPLIGAGSQPAKDEAVKPRLKRRPLFGDLLKSSERFKVRKGMRATYECEPTGGHQAGLGAGNPDPGMSTPDVRCASFTLDGNTDQAAFVYSLGMYLPLGVPIDCGNGSCRFNWSAQLLSPTNGVLHWASGYVTPLSAANWSCYPDPDSPPGQACFTTVSAAVNVAQETAAGEAEFRLVVSVTPESVWDEGSPFELTVESGELVGLKSLRFNYDTDSNSGAGVKMRIDETNDIAGFEWEADVRQKTATKEPFTPETIAPAAYVKKKPLKVKAEFKANQGVQAATFMATTKVGGNPSPYGELAPQTVTFGMNANDEWVAEPVVFTSTLSPEGVAANDVKIEWKLLSITYGEDYYRGNWTLYFPVPVGGRTTQHRIYTLWNAPVAPMVEPWAKVLEISAGMLAPVTLTQQEKMNEALANEKYVQALADGIFYSRWTGYDSRFFKPARTYQYNPSRSASISCGTNVQQEIRLSYVLTELGSGGVSPLELQCNDTSNLHAILSASQGIDARPTLIHSRKTEIVNGEERWVDLEPTAIYSQAGDGACKVSTFNFHEVASLTGAELLYDTSARSASGQISACTPGANFYGMSQITYLSTVFPIQVFGNTKFDRPSVVIVGSCRSN